MAIGGDGEGSLRRKGEKGPELIVRFSFELRRGSDIGRRGKGEERGAKREVLLLEEIVDQGSPDGNACEGKESVAVVAEGIGVDEGGVAAGFGERLVEALGDLRAEVVIVFGVDPEHRRAGFFPEVVKGSDDCIGITNFVGRSRSAATRETDGSEQAGRRIGGECDV